MKLELGDVWCSKCPQPATVELLVTNGRDIYTAAYCGQHAWLLRAPGVRGEGPGNV